MSVNKYKAAQASTENPRQTEYRLFAEVTKALMAVREAATSKGLKPQEFYKAVDWNRRLWLTLQMDLASNENRFPDSLKANIISIAIWVDKHSRTVLRGESNLDPLISVNRTIMEGLSSAPTKQTIPSQAASAIGSLGTSA
ncbi:MAG: flagellar biosynthesis regulator FlaF [Alphaproteobacteria bacterium]